MNLLTEKEQFVRDLIETKFEYEDTSLDFITLRQKELASLQLAPRELSLILDRFKSEKRIRDYVIHPSIKVWTTREYWQNPNLENLDLRYDRDTRALVYGQHKIPLHGPKTIRIVSAILTYSLNTLVDEQDILDKAFDEIDTARPEFQRTVRDTVRRVNKKVAEKTSKKDLFLYQGSKVRTNV